MFWLKCNHAEIIFYHLGEHHILEIYFIFNSVYVDLFAGLNRPMGLYMTWYASKPHRTEVTGGCQQPDGSTILFKKTVHSWSSSRHKNQASSILTLADWKKLIYNKKENLMHSSLYF